MYFVKNIGLQTNMGVEFGAKTKKRLLGERKMTFFEHLPIIKIVLSWKPKCIALDENLERVAVVLDSVLFRVKLWCQIYLN